VSEAALFLHLLLSPAEAQSSDLRAKQYAWGLRLTTLPRQRDLLIRQLVDDTSESSAADWLRPCSERSSGTSRTSRTIRFESG
jgi:hypothetical protein